MRLQCSFWGASQAKGPMCGNYKQLVRWAGPIWQPHGEGWPSAGSRKLPASIRDAGSLKYGRGLGLSYEANNPKFEENLASNIYFCKMRRGYKKTPEGPCGSDLSLALNCFPWRHGVWDLGRMWGAGAGSGQRMEGTGLGHGVSFRRSHWALFSLGFLISVALLLPGL